MKLIASSQCATKTHFLNWDKPALDQAVEFLMRDWSGGSLDLSDWLILVPTRHAGRRLRERLALMTAERGGAVFPGRITTPDILFAPKESEQRTVDAWIASLVWQQVLKKAPPLPHLFPHGAPLDELSIRISIADQLIQLRTLLSDEGHTIASFATAYADNPETARWQDLMELEKKYLATLESLALRDDAIAKIESATDPVLDPAYTSLCLLFTPDPPSLALMALQRLDGTLPIEVCIHAPESLRDAFDTWGRPLVSDWSRTVIPLDEKRIVLSNTPHDQINYIVHRLKGLDKKQRTAIALGVPDSTILPFIQVAMDSAQVDSFDPAGASTANTALYGLMEALIHLSIQRDYDSFARFVRHPFFLDYLAQTLDGFTTHVFLKKLDRLQNTHLPADYDAVRLFSGKPSDLFGQVVEQVDRLLEHLAQGEPEETLQPLLAGLFTTRTLDPNRPADHAFIEVANQLDVYLKRFRALPLPLEMQAKERILLLLNELRKQHITNERSQTAVDLLGWLELPWECAPHLIVTSMADGLVPETIVGHVFLPDEARSAMGLRDNARRFARDAYLLSVLLHSRRNDGTLTLCLAKSNAAGDPLKPSRLLFQCEFDELPDRTLFLFGECAEQPRVQARQQDWLLSIPETTGPVIPSRISITALSDYMSCPFAYYLKRIRKMAPCDDRKLELDALDFGSLAHEALATLADPVIAGCTSPSELTDYLQDQVNVLFKERFGEVLTLPLIIQRDTLYQRFAAVARVECESRQAGWWIESVESDWDMPLAGTVLRGRIDRIDRHETSGAIRILDYKTSNKLVKPIDKHLKKFRAPPDAYRLAPDDRSWVDLQLPLYIALFLNKVPGTLLEQLQSGYFALPQATADTGLYMWEDFNSSFLESACTCACEIIRRIADQIFWPPRSVDKDRVFGSLFFDTAEETVGTYSSSNC